MVLEIIQDDEDEGSLLRSRVNRREQVDALVAGKIERSADAFQLLLNFPPNKNNLMVNLFC